MMTNNILREALNNAEFVRAKEVKQRLVGRWKRTGLLEGLNQYDQEQIAQLLENQAKQLLTESSYTSPVPAAEQWHGVALPLVRRIFANLSTKNMLSVQALERHTGLVFWLDIKYGTNQPGFEHPIGSNDNWQQDSLYGITNEEGEAYGGLYGAGRFGYSLNDYKVSITNNNYKKGLFVYTVPNQGDPFWGWNDESFKFSYADVKYDASMGVYFEKEGTPIKIEDPEDGDASPMFAIYVPTAQLTDLDKYGVRAFKVVKIVNNEEIALTYFPAFTRIVKVNGTEYVRFICYDESSKDVANINVYYHKQPTTGSGTDFEYREPDNSEVQLDIPEINMQLRNEPIVTKTRKLKAVWTPEFAQDISAYHTIDADAEMTSIFGDYVNVEIDLELLDMLINAAPTVEYWSAMIGKKWAGTLTGDVNTDWTYETVYKGDGNSPVMAAYTQNMWYMTLGTKIQKISNLIHSKTLRGGANFMVVSPTISTIIESIPGFTGDSTGSNVEYSFGTKEIGTFNKSIRVYKNPYMKENTILLGFKGETFLEAGAVYAPYIPLITTPIIIDPRNLTPRRGVMTRYAKKITRPEFYGKIYVADVNLI